MQLNLLSRLALRTTQARGDAPVTVPGLWRDSAITQLEAIAAANERVAAARLRRQAAWLAAAGGAALVLSVSLWRPAQEQARALPAAIAAVAPLVTTAQQVAALSTPPLTAATAETVTPVAPMAAAPVAADTPATNPQALAPVGTPADEASRKARAAQAAEARRKANLQAQERARQDEESERQRRAQEQQHEAERAQHRLLAEASRERAAAADQARPQAVLVAQNTRRTVREVCAGGGFLSEQFCQARECRKAEQQGDATCVRLGEIESARLQVSHSR